MNCRSSSSGSSISAFLTIARISSGVEGGRWLRSVRLSSVIAAAPAPGVVDPPGKADHGSAIKTEIGRERDADRRFANPHLGKRQDVGSSPANPDLFGRRRAGGNGGSGGRRGGDPSALLAR